MATRGQSVRSPERPVGSSLHNDTQHRDSETEVKREPPQEGGVKRPSSRPGGNGPA